MANARSPHRVADDPPPRHDYGALEQRVYGTEQMIRDLGTQTSNQFKELTAAFTTAIADINAKLDRQQTWSIQRGQTNWVALIGVAFGAVGAIVALVTVVGSLAKSPIDDKLNYLVASIVPRVEMQGVLASIDKRLEKVEAGVAAAQPRDDSLRAGEKLRQDINAIRAQLGERGDGKAR